ncbi:MAG: nucleoside triphosphate pyrophosphohydrolase [Rhodospirillales bacterium RIFCSPLOWO2_12_FULL_67_15]|nr:MAG: nucleoside triphosphate pyrophosphohydrolase [Rhodospirillales bacterium RIFCSPLOWO2_12_FULL_67_15]
MSDKFDQLVAIMARLRDPKGGCPWDKEQSFATIAPYTVEEAYEVADAIERNDLAGLKDELGDLLFQVVFHARMAEEAGRFSVADVIEAINAKMVRRHPHVFGEAKVKDAADQTRAWEDHKAREREDNGQRGGNGGASALDGVAVGLPALTRALKLQQRAARVGFDWTEAIRILDKLREETEEMEAEIKAGAAKDRLLDEIGDLLFVCVNLARRLEFDPESALRHANAKFERRFRAMEALLAERGFRPEQTSLDEMEALWREAKKSDPGQG